MKHECITNKSMIMNYLDYYHLEKYLFSKVGPEFRKSGKLDALDFFCDCLYPLCLLEQKQRPTHPY